MVSVTPRVAVDVGRLEANIRRFHAAVAPPIRAHVKAHRIPQITARQLAEGAVGIAVQFAREARAHVTAGATDVVVAWPWPDRWRWRLFAELAARCRVGVHVTSAEAVDGIAAAAVAAGTELGVRVQLDAGAGRGVTPDAALTLARQAGATAGVRLDGVTGYAALTTIDQARDADEQGRRLAKLLVGVAEAIRADGLECPTVCAGGTPTAAGASMVDGVTEVCAGAYALLDAGLAEFGWCDLDDVALSISETESTTTLLDRCHQPWAPDVVARRRGADLLPGHTCPLMPRVAELTVVDGEREIDTWPVRCHTDREGHPDAAGVVAAEG